MTDFLDDDNGNFDNEEWIDVPNYIGIYQISRSGKVRSLDRIDSRGWKRKGKEKKLTRTKYGSYQVTLGKHGFTETVLVKTLLKKIEGGASDE